MKTLHQKHILARILDAKRERLSDTRLRVPDTIVKGMVSRAGDVPSFRRALEKASRTGIIAEIKKASPSAGTLVEDLDVAGLASEYAAAGAAAISVVTEEDYFQGNLGWVRVASAASGLPVLRKDFIFDEYQVLETRAAGASAVLLIVAVLRPEELERLLRVTEELGMDALVEVHDELELTEALEAGASIVGVNNRDLKTFEVRLETSETLGPRIPDDVLFVAESGIRSREDMDRLSSAGAAAFLVGEQLIRAPDPGAALRELL